MCSRGPPLAASIIIFPWLARDPGLPDAAALLGLFWLLFGGRRWRYQRLGEMTCQQGYAAADDEAGATAGERNAFHRGEDRREEERGAAKAAGPRRHYSYEPSTKSTNWWYFFCGEKQDDKKILLYTTCMCTCTYMIHVCKFMT